MYVVFQSRDMGCDTDEVENIVLETEWYVLHLAGFLDSDIGN